MEYNNLNLLAFAVPFFFFLMILEYRYSLKKGKKLYNFDEAVANVNVGIIERMSDMFAVSVFHFFFVWVYENFGIFDIKANAVTWILLFLVTDLAWYWYHRFGHEVNLLWSAHVVHHQSEDYNFTVAARITVFQAFFRSVFWSVIPLLGFPPEMITTILLIHGAYPFFTHTQTVGKLGFLEKIFVTPSHHRVHHSSNEQYLDKNYGDVLIIWDKIFGTYMEEDEKDPCVYGLTKPLKSHSFLWQHFHFLLEILVAFKRARGFKAKMKAIFGKPDDLDPGVREELEEIFLTQSSNAERSKTLIRYIFVQSIITLILLFTFLLLGNYQNWAQLLVGSIFLLLSVINTGAMLEQKKWIFHIEFTRVFLLSVYLAISLPYSWIAISAFILTGTIVLWYKTISDNYYRVLSIKF